MMTRRSTGKASQRGLSGLNFFMAVSGFAGMLATTTQLEIDLLDALLASPILERLGADALRLPARILVSQSFLACVQHIDQPGQKAQRIAEAKVLFETLVFGTLARTPAAAL